MDFIYPNRMDFRWGEFGDYYIYDTRAKVSGILEFVKVPKNSLPRVHKVASLTPSSLSSKSSVSAKSKSSPVSVSMPSDDWAAFQVNAIQSILPEKQNKKK